MRVLHSFGPFPPHDLSVYDERTAVLTAVCTTCNGTFPMNEMSATTDGQVWHEGSDFGGDIVCNGPFYLHVPRVCARCLGTEFMGEPKNGLCGGCQEIDRDEIGREAEIAHAEDPIAAGRRVVLL